ncbi:methyltransferase [Sorangium sp. So ce321]|uniref:methyltransferase n=1 Tax=Sorangium sp. So ce321 TaxID=3133300 RepID=UPI003F60A5CA
MPVDLETPTCDDSLIRQLWASAYQLPILSAADELGVFTLLEREPASVAELGEKLSLSARAAEALLASLAAMGLLARLQGKFHLTEVSRDFLLPTKPFYWGPILRMLCQLPLSDRALVDTLRRDGAVAWGNGNVITDEWAQAELPDERAQAFTRAMHSHSFATAVGLAQRVELSGVERLLDVAGGSGCFSIALARRHEGVQFTVAELPPVCKVTRQYVAEHGLEGRIHVVELDMFRDAWPPGHDAIFFANILHDWDGARRQRLIQRSFEALPPGGRVLVYELLLSDAQDGPLTAALMSMNMVFMTPGKQLTASELDELLRGCGFTDVSFTPAYAGYSLISARKPAAR